MSTTDDTAHVEPPPSSPAASLNQVMSTLNMILVQLTTVLPYLQQSAAPPAPATSAPPSSPPPSSIPIPPIPSIQCLPAGVRAPTIEKFDGKREGEVRPWLDRTRMVLRTSGFNLDHPLAVCYAASHLTGSAYEWFERRLGFVDPAQNARDKLRHLRQTTSVRSYADHFQNTIVYLPNRDTADLKSDFLDGLKPEIQALLVGRVKELNTWIEVRNLAYEVDAVLMAARKRIQPSSKRDNRRDDPMELGTITPAPSRQSRQSRPATSHRSRVPSRSSSPPPSSRSDTSSRSSSPSRFAVSDAATAALSSSSSIPPHTRASSSGPRAPLTDTEREFLMKNDGCLYCRKVKAGHRASNCPAKQPKN